VACTLPGAFRILTTNSCPGRSSQNPESPVREGGAFSTLGIVRGHMVRAGPYEVRLGPARSGSYRKPMGVWGCFRISRPNSLPRFRPWQV
jgi:hypothetical protein